MRNGSFSARHWMCDNYRITCHIKIEFGFLNPLLKDVVVLYKTLSCGKLFNLLYLRVI